MKNMSKVEQIESYLDEILPNPVSELKYNKDYELLLAVMLSAQTTDARVNMVTDVLFKKYPSLNDLKNAPIDDIINIIRPIGTFNKKAKFVKDIATIIVDKYNEKTPIDRKILESFPGVGHKTTNVYLNHIYNIPTIAVDTHVERVSKRLGLAKETDSVLDVEHKLMKKYKRENWGKRHLQMVLFGRYYCKSKKPNCKNCKLINICKNKKKEA